MEGVEADLVHDIGEIGSDFGICHCISGSFGIETDALEKCESGGVPHPLRFAIHGHL